jgi:peptidoglycan/LPS O-acetylase OafA/YrhL
LNLKYASPQIFPPRWASAFIINRIFRIYPAFLIAICLSLLLRFFIYDPSLMPPMSVAFTDHWRNPLNIPELLKLLALIVPGIHPDQIDPPMWSLVFEMRVSLFFPLIIFWLARRRKFADDLIFLSVVYVICFFFNQPTARCVPYFVLGAVCAKHFEALRSALGKMNLAQQILWLVAALFMYEAGSMTDQFPFIDRYSCYISQQLIGLGAAAIILASVSFAKIAMCLSSRPFQFIGHTSYSFYLVHMLFQLAPAPLVYHLTGSWIATWLSSLVLTYFVAWLMFKFIEKPMIKKGHAVANWFSRNSKPEPQILAK